MMSRETTLKATGCRPSVTNAARGSRADFDQRFPGTQHQQSQNKLIAR